MQNINNSLINLIHCAILLSFAYCFIFTKRGLISKVEDFCYYWKVQRHAGISNSKLLFLKLNSPVITLTCNMMDNVLQPPPWLCCYRLLIPAMLIPEYIYIINIISQNIQCLNFTLEKIYMKKIIRLNENPTTNRIVSGCAFNLFGSFKWCLSKSSVWCWHPARTYFLYTDHCGQI